MKKVLIIAQHLHPEYGSEPGKGYLVAESLCNDYKLKIYTKKTNRKALERSALKNRVDFEYIEMNQNLTRIVGKYRFFNVYNKIFMKKVIKTIDKKENLKNYEFIHVLTPAGIHCFNEIYKYGVPVLIGPVGGALRIPGSVLQGFRLKERMKENLRDHIYRAIMKIPQWKKYFENSAMILAGTEYVKQYLPGKAKEKTIIFFDTAVDPETFSPRNDVKREYVTFVGRLERQKGCLLALKAFLKIARKNRKQKFLFIGRGALYGRIKETIIAHQLQGQIMMTGPIKRKQVKEYLHKTKVYCLPSLREPGGASVLEAMACECPVVVCDYGGPAYSVDKTCGIKIPPVKFGQIVDDIEKAIMYLLENPDVARQMGKCGRKRVQQNFSKIAMQNKMNIIYQKLIKINGNNNCQICIESQNPDGLAESSGSRRRDFPVIRPLWRAGRQSQRDGSATAM